MKKRFTLCLILMISLLSSMTFFLLLHYLDPYEYTTIAVISLLGIFFLWCSSTATILLYVIKKVYYRGGTHIHHVMCSFRQGSLLAISLIIIVTSIHLGVNAWLSAVGIIVLSTCLELFLKNMQD